MDTLITLPIYKKAPDAIKSPFRYPGGKFYALKHILPFINYVLHDEFREPFVGGGSVFFGKAKAQVNWINDLETELINVYQTIADQNVVHELASMFDHEVASKARHSEIKEFEPSNKLEAAFRTFYLNRTSYSGIINKPAWGYAVGKSSPPQNWGKFLHQASKKLQGVKVTNLDFEDVIKAPSIGKTVLIYLDPPYFHADQKRAYTKPFEIADHNRLAQVLRNTPHYFCLSYDDCSEIRELYNWANIFERKWLYNTANTKGASRIVGNELIITNYQIN